MATQAAIRGRRSAGQRHALASVERQIRAADPRARHKYLRDFAEAFQTYESVLGPAELDEALRQADIILLGDYHALPASQLYCATLLERLAQSGRPLVLALEMVFARDQHILDEWQQGEINEHELRRRIRFDVDWGYDWAPCAELLRRARAAGARVCGLDCIPRGDMRRIAARDRHAALKLAEIRRADPQAQIVVLIGESHLAPNHLPAELAQALPGERALTVLQNVDPLYWSAAGEPCDRVEAVRISPKALCVFNATPLEKYESYRLCIERWLNPGAQNEAPDFAPSVYNLVAALARALRIDQYSPHNSTQPKFLVDSLPEVYSGVTADHVKRLLARVSRASAAEATHRMCESGACYVPERNALLIHRWDLASCAEQVTRFVHAACRGGLWRNPDPLEAETIETDDSELAGDRFYAAVMEHALADFGARLLNPARPAVREADLFALYAASREELEPQIGFSYRDYMQMIDFVVFHKDYEINTRRYFAVPAVISTGRRYAGDKLAFVTRKLGALLGSQLYDAYLAGDLNKRFLRSLFFRKLEKPGVATAAYFIAARRARRK
jgi:hypothetical protein